MQWGSCRAKLDGFVALRRGFHVKILGAAPKTHLPPPHQFENRQQRRNRVAPRPPRLRSARTAAAGRARSTAPRPSVAARSCTAADEPRAAEARAARSATGAATIRAVHVASDERSLSPWAEQAAAECASAHAPLVEQPAAPRPRASARTRSGARPVRRVDRPRSPRRPPSQVDAGEASAS